MLYIKKVGVTPLEPSSGQIIDSFSTVNDKHTNAPSINAVENYVQNYVENYSTTETVIGTWIGKPLYRKVVEFTSVFPAGDTDIPHNISNLKLVVNARLRVLNHPEIFPYMNTSANFILPIQVTNTNFKVRNFTNQNYFDNPATLYAIIEYTKTTD